MYCKFKNHKSIKISDFNAFWWFFGFAYIRAIWGKKVVFFTPYCSYTLHQDVMKEYRQIAWKVIKVLNMGPGGGVGGVPLGTPKMAFPNQLLLRAVRKSQPAYYNIRHPISLKFLAPAPPSVRSTDDEYY